MRGAALLDAATYEAVEHDTSATGQAAVVVALAAVAAAVGGSAFGVGRSLVAYLVGWALWSAIVYGVGTRVFGGTATWGELLRTLGFAQAPAVLLVFGFIPLVGGIVETVVFFWVLLTTLVAVRQALDIPTGKAALTAIVGSVAFFMVRLLVGGLFGIAVR
jgi:hypothetical protein